MNISGTGIDGIMGMAFDNADVWDAVSKAWGDEAAAAYARTPISHLFAQNASVPANFDVHLGRTLELDDTAPGIFVIGGHADGFGAVAGMPALVRVNDRHWSLVLDGMRVDGASFAFNASSTAGVPQGKVVAVLDTGYSWPPLPAAAVDAIYSTVEGALFDAPTNQWIVPCNASTNLTFVFG